MALAKCKECGAEVSDKAGQCPKCGAPVKKKTSTFTWIVAGLIGLGVIGAMSGNHVSSSTPSSSSSDTSGTSAAGDNPEQKWSYSDGKDDVSGKQWKQAGIHSTNSFELEFPYSGGTVGEITLRRHPRYGKDVIFSVNKGQILCDLVDGCSVTVKFDDKKAIHLHAVEPSDHSSDTLFLTGYDRLYKEMKVSKKMLVEVTFFQNGTRGFEYDIDGLKFD